MKLGKKLTTLGMALSLAACTQQVKTEEQQSSTLVEAQNGMNLANYGSYEEFTPKGSPNITCAVVSNRRANDMMIPSSVSVSCFPKVASSEVSIPQSSNLANYGSYEEFTPNGSTNTTCVVVSNKRANNMMIPSSVSVSCFPKAGATAP